MTRLTALLLLATLAAGCAPSYRVEVKNQTSQPVTLWLTKDGPPKEEGWYSPEDLAAFPEESRPRYDLAIVPPGKTADTENLSGEFPRGTNAVLRVYEGQKELFHILEDLKASKSQHADYVLKKGTNRLRVTESPAGGITVEPAR